ncbi:MAG: 30S ribosomal protein S11 [Candidatus Omnitrophica bacterium]|nr:30S ribosomal protein S11 [Candidatus Omnitrophota bacterium]MDD5355177.1 30S ribosomal protein S11 [Candidatus Omnitrophota bacterium]
MAEKKRKKKKVFTNIANGVAHVLATFNNTVITITDLNGNVVCWSSPGIVGYSGSKRSTPFAAQIAATDAAKKALDLGMQSVEVRVKGPGSGRESAIRAIQAAGLNVKSIKDVTPIPHNGCRPPKRRRV